MLSLLDIVERTSPPTPWTEGDNIPWNDPGFSSRMLTEHLSQDHDLASRRTERIDRHIKFLAAEVLPAPPAQILDLACGPGLYLQRLAGLGYGGTGIDFSPSSIAHAIEQADDAEIDYRLDDLRTCTIGKTYGAALLLYGQLNVFRRSEAQSILNMVFAALNPGGVFIVEPQTFEHIKAAGQAPPVWSSHPAGLFSADPHLVLTDNHWNGMAAASTQRFYVVDAQTGSVDRHALSNEAYTKDELVKLLENTGFIDIRYRVSLSGEESDDGLCALTAVRP